jgi:hypothetical protein
VLEWAAEEETIEDLREVEDDSLIVVILKGHFKRLGI